MSDTEAPLDMLCFGVGCARHGECRRYQTKDYIFTGVERRGFCDDRRSMFLPIIPIKGEATLLR